MLNSPENPTQNLAIINGFGWFLLVIGALMLAFGIYFLWMANSTNWVRVKGEVANVSIKTSIINVGDAVHRTTQYYPNIEYRYAVNGIEYQSDRYQLGTTHQKFNSREEALEHARAFAVGSAIDVFYDPQSPSSAVLSRDTDISVWVPSILGLFFLLSGIGMLTMLKPVPNPTDGASIIQSPVR
ncbi:MAG: DUF3592 domain-containing protein [Pirellulaceae bacterium]